MSGVSGAAPSILAPQTWTPLASTTATETRMPIARALSRQISRSRRLSSSVSDVAMAVSPLGAAAGRPLARRWSAARLVVVEGLGPGGGVEGRSGGLLVVDGLRGQQPVAMSVGTAVVGPVGGHHNGVEHALL